ncbi:MAG: PAS domain-containing protein [Fimbriimonadaceae bacterium]
MEPKQARTAKKKTAGAAVTSAAKAKRKSAQSVAQLESAIARELKLVTERLDYIMANTPGVMYQLEIDGEQLTASMVSEGMERFLGVKPADATYAWWKSSVHPDDIERALATIQAGIEAGSYMQE